MSNSNSNSHGNSGNSQGNSGSHSNSGNSQGNSGNSGPRQLSSPFYAQWQTNGNSGSGQWKLSTSGSNPWSSTSSYDIAAGTYTIYFSGSINGNGSPSTVFAQVTGGSTAKGVTFPNSSSSNKAATLGNYTTNGGLTLSAAQLLSGDPKITLGLSRSKGVGPTDVTAAPETSVEPEFYPQCWILWSGNVWHYSYARPSNLSDPSTYGNTYSDNGPDLMLTPDAQLYVTDPSSNGAHTCAIYQGSSESNSGEYYPHVRPNPDPISTPGQTFTFFASLSAGETDRCTVNLFRWLGDDAVIFA